MPFYAKNNRIYITDTNGAIVFDTDALPDRIRSRYEPPLNG